jgi:hypothetical protein
VDAAEAGAFAWVGLVESTPEEFALPPRRMAVSEPLRKVRRRTGDSDRKGTP